MNFVFNVKPATGEVDITYEAETVEEGIATLNSEGMQRLLAQYQSTPVAPAESTPPVDNTTAAPSAEPAKKRGRPPKNQPAPETATAPPPAPIPTAAPVPPVPPLATAPAPTPDLTIPADGSIPAFLAKAPAPPAPPAPPAAPSIILGPKIRAHIEATATDDATKKQYLDWLASPGIGLVIPNVSWDEAMGVLQYTTDAQCGGVAKALGVS